MVKKNTPKNKPKKDHTKNLIPLNMRSKEERRAIQSKGGRSKSPRKILQSRINGLLAKKGISDEMRYILAKMRDKNYGEVLNELISMNVEKSSTNQKIRDKAIDQLQKFMPTKVMAVNANINIDIDKDNTDVKEHLKKILGK